VKNQFSIRELSLLFICLKFAQNSRFLVRLGRSIDIEVPRHWEGTCMKNSAQMGMDADLGSAFGQRPRGNPARLRFQDQGPTFQVKVLEKRIRPPLYYFDQVFRCRVTQPSELKTFGASDGDVQTLKTQKFEVFKVSNF
jgi:hypothetical protein